jgi:hypothetical protein
LLNSIKLKFIPLTGVFLEKLTAAQRVKDSMMVFVGGSGSVLIDPHSIPFRFIHVIVSPR